MATQKPRPPQRGNDTHRQPAPAGGASTISVARAAVIARSRRRVVPAGRGYGPDPPVVRSKTLRPTVHDARRKNGVVTAATPASVGRSPGGDLASAPKTSPRCARKKTPARQGVEYVHRPGCSPGNTLPVFLDPSSPPPPHRNSSIVGFVLHRNKGCARRSEGKLAGGGTKTPRRVAEVVGG